jgi:integrase/recombinase XerD
LEHLLISSDIDDFLAAELLENGLSLNTRTAYGDDLLRFAAFLESRAITWSDQVSHDDIVGFLSQEVDRGMSGSTRARRTVAIRMFFKYLKTRRLIQNSPCDILLSPRKSRALPRVLSEDEVTRMIDGINGDDPRSLRDKALLETLYGLGLRVSEACFLKLEDIISAGELVRIVGKGSKERIVPIGACASRALNNYLTSARVTFTKGDLSQTHVFVTRLGRPFTRQGVFKIVRERAGEAGISFDRISPHVLRHSCASHLLAHGADIRVIQEFLGHSDIGTTQIYTHIDAGRFEEIHKLHPRHD